MSDDTTQTEAPSELFELYITFGQKYAPPGSTDWLYSEENRHPLGMHRDGYAVIEAPNYGIARGIANAVFGEKFAFDYPASSWDAKQNEEMGWYVAGEILRIRWERPEDRAARWSEDVRALEVKMSSNRAGEVRMMPNDPTGAGEVL